jgi:PAS domain S-box-containing protein
MEDIPIFRALRGETVTGAEAIDERVEAPDGSVYEVSVSSAPVRDLAGDIVGAVAVSHDVTEHRRLERRVAEQAGELEAIFAAMADGVFVADARGRVTRMNAAARAIIAQATGEELTAETIGGTAEARARAVDLGDDRGRAIPAADVPTARLLRGETLDGAAAQVVQLGSHSDDAEPRRTVSITGGPLRDAAGRVVGAVGVMRDVTELQRVQAALAERERQFRTLVEHSPDIINRFDPLLRVVYVNPRGEEALGISAAERVGKTFAELGLPEALYAPWERTIRDVFASGEPRELDIASPIGGGGADGARTYHYRARYVPEVGPNGAVATVLAITTDVTELRRAEARLQAHIARAATEAERARLAGELHDTVTQELYSASLIAEALPQVWKRDQAAAERALGRLHEITSGGLATLRLLLLELRPDGLEGIALPSLLRQLLAAMRARAGVPLRLEAAGTGGDTDGDWEALPQEVTRAFYRMAQEAVTNAIKYAAAGMIVVRLWPERRGTLRMEIVDDGVGFDPRAGAPGHFGLPIMRDRAQQIGATARVRSQIGHGTRVVVRWRPN